MVETWQEGTNTITEYTYTKKKFSKPLFALIMYRIVGVLLRKVAKVFRTDLDQLCELRSKIHSRSSIWTILYCGLLSGTPP